MPRASRYKQRVGLEIIGEMKMKRTVASVVFLLGSINGSYAATGNPWAESTKTMKDIVDEGYEVRGMTLFSRDPNAVWIEYVLQKGTSVYTCAEFDDNNLVTNEMDCEELVNPSK